MKKNTKYRRARQPRSRRSSQGGRSPLGEILSLRDQLRETLIGEIRSAVAATACALVEDEVRRLVGEPWSRKGDSPLRRNGATTSTIHLDGEPCLLPRARVRDRNMGSEVRLQTLQALSSRDALDADVKRRMIRGLSTRDYDDALGALSDGLGLQKSAVSEAFVRASKKDLDQLNGRSLAEAAFLAAEHGPTSVTTPWRSARSRSRDFRHGLLANGTRSSIACSPSSVRTGEAGHCSRTRPS